MKIICAWCKKELGEIASSKSENIITHGICEICRKNLLTNKLKLRNYLNSLDLPIFVIDNEGKILMANENSIKLLGKKAANIENSLGGDAMECAYAHLPGGCGKTIHCKTCTIRNSVIDTYNTGKSLDSVPAYLDQKQGKETKKIKFLISTEKIGEIVLLRIDEIGS